MTAIGNPRLLSDGDDEEILVLYGSQTGNSEAAAHEICSLLPVKLSTLAATTLLPSTSSRVFTSRVMHLDDFLEVEKARWTRLVIIVTSSYGVGQAPIGARKFRDVCDEILNRYDCNKSSASDVTRKGGMTEHDDGAQNNHPRFLEGIHFALLGLGDSHYTTFFKNPSTIHRALTLAGATLVGDIGKADASGTGNMEQSKVIDRWIEGIWGELAKVVDVVDTATSTVTSKSVEVVKKSNLLEKARNETWDLCLELFPEWKKKNTMTNYVSMMVAVFIPLFGIIVALLAHHFFFHD